MYTMGKYRRNKEMMQRMYGAEALQEAFEGIMPQPIQIHNYIESWVNEPAGVLTVTDYKAFKKWCKENDISRLYWKEVGIDERMKINKGPAGTGLYFTDHRIKDHVIAFKNLDDLTFATLRWK